MSSRIATPTVSASTRKKAGSPGAVVSPPPIRNAKVAGTTSPMVARMSDAAFMPVACESYDWIPFLSPPTSSEAPRTRSRLPTIEPVIEAWTISILLSAIRKPAMMISPMLPTVAFMMPPMRGPAARPSCSVACPRV